MKNRRKKTGSAAKSALDTLNAGLQDISDAASLAGDAISKLNEALEVANTEEELKNAIADANEAINHLGKWINATSSAVNEINSLISYFENVDKIQFPTPDTSLLAELGRLLVSIMAIEGNTEELFAKIHFFFEICKRNRF